MVMLTMALIAGGWIAFFLLSPWDPLTTVRHLASSPNCSAARAVGLARATRGEPGYWLSHDADDDGIACEDHDGHRTPYIFRRF
ncbi:MAG: excalibur calcium-binding domain-containing protein [Devosia sp.]